MIVLKYGVSDVLARGQQLVVPSSQRASAIRLAAAAAELADGRHVWRTPDVVGLSGALDALARRLRSDGEDLPRVLAAQEEWLLWSAAAESLTAEVALLLPEPVADQLRRAANRLAQYGISTAAVAADPALESAWLVQSTREVEAQARRHHAQPAHELIEALARSRPSAEPRGALVGFLSLPRALGRIFAAHGYRPLEASRGTERSTNSRDIQVVGARHAMDELERAADWAAERLAADPRVRLLVVVPDLAARRHHIERTFGQRLCPAAWLAGQPSTPQFAIEGGRALTDYTEVGIALDALSWLTRPLRGDRCRAVLTGDLLGRANRGLLARLALQCPFRDDALVDLDGWMATAQGLPPPFDRLVAQLETRFALARQSLPKPRRYTSDWAVRCSAALSALGWPGSETLDSVAYQLHRAWRETLTVFARAAAIVGPCDASGAIDMLRQFARRANFAPASGDVGVVVTGVLDDPVVHYDGIWVCGLQAERWPAPVRPDPFIPGFLQRAAGLPDASPAASLELARAQLGAWTAATSELRLSYAREQDDAHLMPSPLLAGLPVATRSERCEDIQQSRDGVGPGCHGWWKN